MPTSSFLSFDLELGPCATADGGGVTFTVRAAQTPRAQVQPLEAADRVTIEQGGIERVIATLANRWDAAESEFAAACATLGRWLLPQPSRVRSLLEASLAGLAAGEALFLRIRCDDDGLARLPWEFAAFDIAGVPEDGKFRVDRMLAMHPQICVSRFEALTTPVDTRPPTRAGARMLFVNAAPPELEALALKVERDRIERALSGCEPRAEPTWVEHVTIRSLQGALVGAQFDVFQFSGHGGSSRGGFLCFEPEEGSDGTFPADKLGLALSGTRVRLAVLAACVSAEIERELPWSGVARALVAGGVPAVVGMQLNISDESAVEFLSTFYVALAKSAPIGAAMNDARKAIGLFPELDRDFGVPVLYLRNAEQWDQVVFPPPPRESELERRIRAADAYKRLHDSLHKAKMDAFHLILRFADDFPPKSPANRRPLRSYVNTIKVCVNEMRNIAAEGRCDDDLIRPLIESLATATEQLDSALASWDHDTFVDALPQLNSVFGREMSMLDVSLHNSTKELPATGAGRSPTHRDLAQFQALIDEMKVRVVTHHACQRLENLLDDLRDPRSGEGVNVSALKRRWQELSTLLEACLPALDNEASASLTQRSALLQQSLAAQDTEQLAMAYEDFCAEVGMSFYKIDSDLKGMCARLCADPRLTCLATP